jgi:hypothetical protein
MAIPSSSACPDRLIVAGISRAEPRELRRYRQFYLTYPQIRETLTPEFGTTLLAANDGFTNNRESPTPEFGSPPAMS